MKLTAYIKDGWPLDIRAADGNRKWMDDTHVKFANRCLPLRIANAFGWEMLCPTTVHMGWNGRNDLDSVLVQYEDASASRSIMSHFGYGTVTFSVSALFRTEPGYDLMVQGPINTFKDAIAPLSGIVETDWAPYTFTMNWKFTRPGTIVTFTKGEPFCHIFPVPHRYLENFEPNIMSIKDDPELESQLEAWSNSRMQFNAGLKNNDKDTVSKGWQKNYFHGKDMDGEKGTDDHITKLKLKEFKDNTIKVEMQLQQDSDKAS